MGVFDEIKAAFADAGRIMAQVSGMSDTAEGNTMIGTRRYTGVYGPPQVDRQMLPQGGYRQRTVVQWTVPREQIFEALRVNTELVRIDMDPHITYRIERVNVHDPVHYICALIRVGE